MEVFDTVKAYLIIIRHISMATIYPQMLAVIRKQQIDPELAVLLTVLAHFDVLLTHSSYIEVIYLGSFP